MYPLSLKCLRRAAGSACDGAEKDWALEAGAVTAGAIPARGAVDLSHAEA